MSKNNRDINLYWYIWAYPILLFLIVLYSFKDSGGTDFNRQLASLLFYENDNLSFLLEDLIQNEERILFHIIYNVLHSFLGIKPRLYIASITFVYFCFMIFIMQVYCKRENHKVLSKKELSNICLFTLLCFCPIFFTISRNFLAITFLYLGILLFFQNKFVIATIPIILAIFVHEGISLMYAIMITGGLIYFIWLRKNKNYFIRNIVIISVSIFLLITGSSYFTSITTVWFENGLLSEHYMDSYGIQESGDGIYKLVIVLSMLGPLICLFVNCLIDKRNNIIYSIMVAGLFSICLLFNQKIFLVQRIMIFMPIFIGLTSYQICSDYIQRVGKISYLYLLFMILVPINVLFQFLIQFNMYFGNL